MIWMVKNIKDDRIVLKHTKYDRYYVGSFGDCDCNLKLFTTKNIDKAYDVLEATKYHWAGINVDGWKVVEAFG